MLNILLQNVEDINTLEKAAMEIACKYMELFLQLLEKKLFEEKPGHYKVLRIIPRTIATRLGEIKYKRRYYKNTKTGEKVFLLDEALGIRKGKRVSGEMLKLLVTLANKLTFRQAEEVIKDAGYPSLSHATIHKEVREFGEEESKRVEHEREKIFTEGKNNITEKEQQKNPEILFLEADGIMLSSQEENERRMEVKVGLMHEGWTYSTPARKRRKLINPTVVCGVYRNAEEFWEEFSAEIARRYRLEDTVVVLNGDGARWIQKRAKEYFPDIIVQLDRYHIKRDLRRHFGKEVADDMFEVLAEGRKKTFLDTLESLAYAEEKAETKRKKLKLVKHYRRYTDHLLDYRKRLPSKIDKKNLYGMGAIEGYVGKIIARRMKNQGMSWSRDGAEAMVKILMLSQHKNLRVRLSDKKYTIENPVKKIKKKIKNTNRDWQEWLKARMPALRGPASGKNWVKALRSTVTV